TAAGQQLLGVVKEVEPEVEQTGRYWLAVQQRVLFLEVPAAWPYHQCRELLIQAVPFALRTRVLQGPADRLHAVELAGNNVGPGRRERILEIRHEDLGPGIERVDHHLPFDRSGDLHPSIVQVSGCGRHLPAA